MDYEITRESFESLTSVWKDNSHHLRWEPLFILPPWLVTWWQSFGSGYELYLVSVRKNNEIIGIAPLMLRENIACIIGSDDVCDFLDFVVLPGREQEFFSVVLEGLRQKGVACLELRTLRPESAVMTGLLPLARQRGCVVVCNDEAVSVEVALPATWDEYLDMLDKKQRHEIRRKLRRLLETEKASHRCIQPSVNEVGPIIDTFMRLFTLTHKAGFMSKKMESYFRSLAGVLAGEGLLNVSLLELNAVTVAMTIGFDYNNSLYFYNSAYDPSYRHLSVGVLSKVLCLKYGIEMGRDKGDFLKGAEKYKYHVGGREVPLYSCRIMLG